MEMGWLLGAYSKWEEALRSYRRAVALRPEDARAHFRIGNTHFQLTNYVEARDSYERALQVLARTPSSYVIQEPGDAAEPHQMVS